MRKIILLMATAGTCFSLSISIQAATQTFICPAHDRIMIRTPLQTNSHLYEYLGDFNVMQSSKAYDTQTYLGIPTTLIGKNGKYTSVEINAATGTMACSYESDRMSVSKDEVVTLVSPDNMLGTADGSYTCSFLGREKISINHPKATCTGKSIEDCEVTCTSQGQ
jgi:hypothetical protein